MFLSRSRSPGRLFSGMSSDNTDIQMTPPTREHKNAMIRRVTTSALLRFFDDFTSHRIAHESFIRIRPVIGSWVRKARCFLQARISNISNTASPWQSTQKSQAGCINLMATQTKTVGCLDKTLTNLLPARITVYESTSSAVAIGNVVAPIWHRNNLGMAAGHTSVV